MLQRVNYVTPHYFLKRQKHKIKAIKVVFEMFKLAKQSCYTSEQLISCRYWCLIE